MINGSLVGGARTASPAQPEGPESCPSEGLVMSDSPHEEVNEGEGMFQYGMYRYGGLGLFISSSRICSPLCHEKVAVSACIILCILFSFMLTLPFNFFPI